MKNVKVRDPMMECLRYAADNLYTNLLVRLPSSVPVGSHFSLRLADLAEEIAFGVCYRVFVPLAIPQRQHRNYVLRWPTDTLACFLSGLKAALVKLKLAEHAEVFIADQDDQIMRRLVW